ncbi:hypothetical protein P691DRAFT_776265 [Macrolepiota fuliginosa MF-IS2]|uniref:Uncharacterized protein n=1 Tax=Macrolepiota fuliginosa MF-IS2 TaxID=1400762 RepID=A0A9P5XCD7_9AGAR|nr:hypothetical protein P691DRAFT_776265 [Macrolepiota fuliginosa MF-IS2]
MTASERQALLKAWGELDITITEGPVDYLWLFYSAFYSAKGMHRMNTFYVVRLAIWKEPATRMSFFHEYLVATIRSTDPSDRRKYYLLFERTAGWLNTDKKKEEDFGQNSVLEQEGDEPRTRGEEIGDFSFIPDREQEDKTFWSEAQGHQPDKGGRPQSVGMQNSASPQSDGISGMVGMLLAAKNLASQTSESSSADLILADDRYQLIDRPYRHSSDIEVAWITLAQPPINPEQSAENIAGPPPAAPSTNAAPDPSLSSGGPQDKFRSRSVPGSIYHTHSNGSSVSDIAHRTRSLRGDPVDTSGSPHPRVNTMIGSKLDLDSVIRPRVASHTSTVSHISYSSHLPGHQPQSPVRLASISVTSLETSQTPADNRALHSVEFPPTETLPSTSIDQLPFITPSTDTEDAPALSEPLAEYPNTSLFTEGLENSFGHPLSRPETKTSQVSASSLWRPKRKRSFSTLDYDATAKSTEGEPHVFLFQLVALACRLHKCTSLYRIFTRNCYWFAGMIFHVVRVYTGTDASICGEDGVDRMKPSDEVMLWVNSGRMGTFLRSIRIVKAPRLFTVHALIRKWKGANLRFRDQVAVNFADSTPQQLRIVRLAFERAKAIAETEKRKREEIQAEAERKAKEAAREAELKAEELREQLREMEKRLKELESQNALQARAESTQESPEVTDKAPLAVSTE